MALALTYQGQTTIPVEIEGLTPTWARDKSLAEIREFEIFHGNQKLPLGEMFDIEGNASDLQFDFHGDLSGVHWIGAHMSEGEIHIHGPGGRHIGSEMRGGRIEVAGDAGGWAGAEMSGGLLHIHGHAGHLVGAAYRGSVKGMTGGTILVDGDVGNEVGLTMRRGLIAVGGSAGDMLGFNMIAGTVFIFGECGIRPGAGMRRGTLGLFGPLPPALLPSFRFACNTRVQVIPLINQKLRGHGFTAGEESLDNKVDIYSGDHVALGKGEVFIRS
ncbi:MAG: formylmethanofuran dehydrogenase subunit C [Planctomycetaceae bacterium]|nr:formylmethanofuran dehydrogenase subunit C [Planctomycetaceae bacterium]